MELKLVRKTFGSTFTKGELLIDNKHFCYVIEDVDRHLETAGCKAKVQDKTCIPRGTYTIITDYSNHFGKTMIHLLNVPCFEGVRIHSGNSSADTEGCLIVAYNDTNKDKDWLGNSKAASQDLLAKVQASLNAGNKVTITIS
jgi:hypothetical protein